MSYVSTNPVEFPHSRQVVYEALRDLGHYPQWTSGMTSISHTGQMRTGLVYETKTNVLGRVNKSVVKVVKLIPSEAIVLESRAGLVTFRAVYELAEVSPDSCKVICNLKFTFSNLVFKLAQSAVEGLAEARVRGDLEMLRDSLDKEKVRVG